MFKGSLPVTVMVLLLSACGSKFMINEKHPLLAKGGAKELATVYIIRPMTRYSGVTDRPLNINLGKEELVVLPKGFYTQVKIKPTDAAITVKSFMQSGVERTISQTSEKAQFTFQGGKTYFIYLKPYYRGYNWGTSFKPKTIQRKEAKELTKRLKPIGLAAQQPI